MSLLGWGLAIAGIGKVVSSIGRSWGRSEERKREAEELGDRINVLGRQEAGLQEVQSMKNKEYYAQIGQTLSLQQMEASFNALSGVQIAKNQLMEYKGVKAENSALAGEALTKSAMSGFRNTGTNASLHAGYGEENTDIARTATAIKSRQAVSQAMLGYEMNTAQAMFQAKSQYLDKDYRMETLELQRQTSNKQIQQQIDEVRMTKENLMNKKSKLDGTSWGDGFNHNYVDQGYIWEDIFDFGGTTMDIVGDSMVKGSSI